jgi:steroid delta-isomerase
MNNTDTQIRHVYEQWHQTILNRDLQGLVALYAADAVFESPAVWVLNRQSDGVLRGRAAIESYFDTFFSKFRRGAADWYRDGTFFSDGKLLTWEYPRATPKGDQTDLVESMDLVGGLIARHRVYWGWVGLKNLMTTLDGSPSAAPTPESSS